MGPAWSLKDGVPDVLVLPLLGQAQSRADGVGGSLPLSSLDQPVLYLRV